MKGKQNSEIILEGWKERKKEERKNINKGGAKEVKIDKVK